MVLKVFATFLPFKTQVSSFFPPKSSDLQKKDLHFFLFPPGWYDYDYKGCTNFFGSTYIVLRFSNFSPIPSLLFSPLMRFQIFS